MKRCPKCNRTFQTDTQKFCTHDGGLLFAVDTSDLDKTVKFDSAKIHNAVPKPTTRDLEAQKPHFDPEATVVTPPADDEATTVVRARDTQDLAPPEPTRHQIVLPPQAAVPPPPPPASTSGPIAAAAPSPPPTPTSGPITTSAPLPPPQPSTSGPIATPQVAQVQPGQPVPAARAKKSKLPLVLGILAVLFVLGIGGLVGAYFLVVKPRLEARRIQPVISEPGTTNPSLPTTETPTEVATPSNEPPPYSPPADAVEFVNSKDNLEGKLLENYIDFSFYYPDRWVKVPSAGNFVTVERRLPPDFTQENFAAAPWYSPEESTVTDNEFFHKLAEKDDADFAKRFPEYRKVSEGPTKVGVYDAYEFRFEAVSRGTDKGDITLWGREIFFSPRQGEKAGLKFLILTTSLAPELKSADDIGQKGELPMLLESFRFGKK